MSRLPWKDYFLDIARSVAGRSTCPRCRVGCVIVSHDRRILSTGYNGSPPGEPHCEDVGCYVVGEHCLRAVHAEVNAVASAARLGVSIRGSTAYVVGTPPKEPCGYCCMVLRCAGVGGIVVGT